MTWRPIGFFIQQNSRVCLSRRSQQSHGLVCPDWRFPPPPLLGSCAIFCSVQGETERCLLALPTLQACDPTGEIASRKCLLSEQPLLKLAQFPYSSVSPILILILILIHSPRGFTQRFHVNRSTGRSFHAFRSSPTALAPRADQSTPTHPTSHLDTSSRAFHPLHFPFFSHQTFLLDNQVLGVYRPNTASSIHWTSILTFALFIGHFWPHFNCARHVDPH